MRPDDVIKVALAEVGYIGKKTNADLDIKTANTIGDYTRYARDLAKYGYYNFDKNGYAWCCCFVDWCFLAAAKFDKENALKVKPVSTYGAVVDFIKTEFPASRIYKPDDNIIAGMQILFKDSTGELCHTGIITAVDSNTIKTIEGNVSHTVVARTYVHNDPSIDSCIMPYYDLDDEITISREEYEKLTSAYADLQTIRRIICGGKNG